MNNTDIAGVEFLPNDIFVKIIVNTLDPDDYYEFRNTFTYEFIDKYIKNEDVINKKFLEKYKVDYEDPNNFIYKSNDVKQSYCKTLFGYWNWRRLVEMYSIHFRKKTIICSDMEITSFPIYPNMVKFIGDNNLLKEFPSQPKMELFIGHHNCLTQFAIQPEMIHFEGNVNKLTYFASQPKMALFYGMDNNISVFCTQPKMTNYYGDNIYNFNPQPNINILCINRRLILEKYICKNIKKRIRF